MAASDRAAIAHVQRTIPSRRARPNVAPRAGSWYRGPPSRMRRHRMADAPRPSGPLHGMRVLDCTHVIAGAWCSMLLADLGADVIKIEPPKGEVTRTAVGPFRAYDFVNRNKRAIAVDMAKPEGAAALRRLAAVGRRLGRELSSRRARSTGPRLRRSRARQPGAHLLLDLGLRARRSVPRARRARPGRAGDERHHELRRPPGREPRRRRRCRSPISTPEPSARSGWSLPGRTARRPGEGQRVEATLLESALAYTVWEAGMYFTLGEVAQPRGSRHRLAAPYEALKTGDG